MTTKLIESFAAVYTLLERPRMARWAVAGLLVIHTLLLGYSAYVHSPTLNEPAHLVAGLSHWKFGRFELYRVNPPLVRMVAAIPVMAVGYKDDSSGFYEGPGARPEMEMGENFIAANGERSSLLFMIARWGCIPFSWIGGIVCSLWARDLYGRPAGVMAAGIWCFEPNVLAHASLITADAAATALGLAASYTFWRWLKEPTWTQAAITGVVLGLAELAKTTLIVFYPLWPLMWLIYRWPERHSMFARDWLREAAMLAMRMLIGLYMLNLGYGFEGSLTQLKDFQFVSDLFTRMPTNPQSEIPNRQLANRFGNTSLGGLLVPLPKNYLVGIDIQQKDFELYGRQSYLRGAWQNRGWWYYYLYACAIKVPLGLWALGCVLLILRLRRLFKFGHQGLDVEQLPSGFSTCSTSTLRDEFVLIFPAIVIFIIVSSKSGFSEHTRYVLPAFPFYFVAASQSALAFRPTWQGCRALLTGGLRNRYSNKRVLQRVNYQVLPLVRLFVATCFTWFIASSLLISPHSLAYFNESIGGPLNGSNHLLGSNVDWGQDFRYLKWWKATLVKDGSMLVLSDNLSVPIEAATRDGLIVRRDVLGVDLSEVTSQFAYAAISENIIIESSGLQHHRSILFSAATSNLSNINGIRFFRCGYSFRIYKASSDQRGVKVREANT